MKLTRHQQELMAQAGAMCVQTGAEIQAALRSCRSTIAALDELIGSVEDPDERDQWSTVRQLWIDIAVPLEVAFTKFEKG